VLNLKKIVTSLSTGTYFLSTGTYFFYKRKHWIYIYKTMVRERSGHLPSYVKA